MTLFCAGMLWGVLLATGVCSMWFNRRLRSIEEIVRAFIPKSDG